MLNMADERKADSPPPLIGRGGRRHSVILASHIKKLLSPFNRNWAATYGTLKLIKCVWKRKRKKNEGVAGAWPCGARGPANQLICITVTFSYENLAEVDAEWVRQIKRPVGGSVSGTWRLPRSRLFFFLPFNSTNCKWLLFHLDFIRKHIKPIKIWVCLFTNRSEGSHKRLDTQYVAANWHNDSTKSYFFEWNMH